MPYIKDPKLAGQGRLKIEYAETHMRALLKIREEFSKTQPFKGLTIGMALHVTKETAVLVETFQAGGAKVAIASCNPLSTQDDVAAALAANGTEVFAYKGESDGCDLISLIHTEYKDLIPQLIGGCEETTTGIIRLRAMEKDNALKYPIIAINDNLTKHLVDNYYGTGQSTWDGILRATNVLIAGKTVVVAGYGDCGKGVSLRARGMGANVIVTEINAFRALQAKLDGFRVMKMIEAAPIGDIFITVTGNKNVISSDIIKDLKSGAILANAGHFNAEIDIEALERLKTSKKEIRAFLEEYKLPPADQGSKEGRAEHPSTLLRAGSEAAQASEVSPRNQGGTVYLVSQGRLCNLGAAEGHPSEVMSLSFCGQALACKYILDNRGKLSPGVHRLPPEIDDSIARMQLESIGIEIDSPTPEQLKYMSSWQEGT